MKNNFVDIFFTGNKDKKSKIHLLRIEKFNTISLTTSISNKQNPLINLKNHKLSIRKDTELTNN